MSDCPIGKFLSRLFCKRLASSNSTNIRLHTKFYSLYS